jgi:hypothetical protein
MPNWRRTESRVVRPFQSVEAALSNVRLKLRADAQFDDRTSFEVSELDSGDIRPEFELNVRIDALEAVRPLTAADLALVIKLTDTRLWRSEPVFVSDIEDLPRTWTVPPAVKDRFSWKFGLIASVALVLKANRSPEPGLPYLRGHWIDRKDFSVRPITERRAFPIERWTAEDFARRGLPRDTVYWIEFLADDLNDRFDDPSGALRVCLRADAYDTLLDTEETPAGRAVMKLIEAEILAEVLWRGLDALEPGDDISRGSLLHTVVAKVVKATGTNEQELRQVVTTRRDLSTLRTFAQAAINVRRDVTKLRSAN